MTNTAIGTRVQFHSDWNADDEVLGTVVGIATTHPDGAELVEPMIWVLWDDETDPGAWDLLTWDDVLLVG